VPANASEGFFEEGWTDIGHGHSIKPYSWSPDRALNPQYADIPDIAHVGVLVRHTGRDGNPCVGSIMFDLPEVHAAGLADGLAVCQRAKSKPNAFVPRMVVKIVTVTPPKGFDYIDS